VTASGLVAVISIVNGGEQDIHGEWVLWIFDPVVMSSVNEAFVHVSRLRTTRRMVMLI
jgi:hypothetical protein